MATGAFRLRRLSAAALLGAVAVLLDVGVGAAQTAAPTYEHAAIAYARKDYAGAFDEMLAAAEAGHAIAQSTVAVMYDAGQAVKPDPAAAAKWYGRAAAQGHAVSEARLATLYLAAKGVPLDRKTAYQWMLLAVDSATGAQRDKYRSLAQTIAKTLNNTELLAAAKAAGDWRPSVPGLLGPFTEPGVFTSQGSGFFINRTGALVTNYHVVASCGKIIVTSSGKSSRASIVGADVNADLALLAAGALPAAAAPLAATLHPTPDTAIDTYGFSLTRASGKEMLTTAGRVVVPETPPFMESWFTTTAPIYRGQSGGPVTDGDGRVVGVVKAVSSANAPHDFADQEDGAAVAVDLERLVHLLALTNTDYERDSKGLSRAEMTNADATPVARIDCWR
jgi:S1-C subfamily serine protease